MSDQPKPATGDEAYDALARSTPRESRSPFSPKPTTSITKEWLLERAHLEEGCEIGAGKPDHTASGEWTAQTVTDMGGTNDWQVANEIATAHNADLAAERMRCKETVQTAHAECSAALAVERGVAEEALNQRSELTATIHQLREQLAATQQRYDDLYWQYVDMERTLAAAQDRTDQLTDPEEK